MENATMIQSTPSAFWNERYSSYVTVYGDNPNEFFKDHISKISPGKLLLPGEGEGRNAVFAAKRGWNVDAFDYSEAGRTKALARAAAENVSIHYITGDINDIIIPDATYDAIGLIYIHLKPEVRKIMHEQAVRSLKTGGHLILEAFSKAQINNISGGPRDINLLYDLDEVVKDFKGLKILFARTERIRLNEGPFHQGKADVIRIVATKPA